MFSFSTCSFSTFNLLVLDLEQLWHPAGETCPGTHGLMFFCYFCYNGVHCLVLYCHNEASNCGVVRLYIIYT